MSRREKINALIAEAGQIEERLSLWQTSKIPPNSSEIKAGTRAYQEWYSKAMRFVPDGDTAEFKNMYEGGAFVSRIRAFLSDPIEANLFWKPESPDPLIPKLQNPFNTTFKESFDRQQEILVLALHGETAISHVLDDLADLFARLPEYLNVFSRLGNERVQKLSIENESDLQIVVEAILRLHYSDVRAEDYVPDYGGGKSRVDFMLQESGVVIETKMTRDQLKDRKVGEELLVDFGRYSKHPDALAVFALVYDPGRLLTNAAGLERDLTEMQRELAMRTVVVR